MKIIFNNHASVTIKTEDVSIITDPWFSGGSFNNGWNLVYENPEPEQNFLKEIDYIWISHEHPDHFQPSFFIRNQDLIKKKNIKILFQKTRDKRVFNFLEKLKLTALEIQTGEKIRITDKTSIIIFNAELYDSSLFVCSGNYSVLNLNDCKYSKQELIKIKKNVKKIDVLLTQFSYASWKGGKNNVKWRVLAANEKLDEIKKQCMVLDCKIVIPIASFIYFSHVDNFYLNDSVNTIEKVSNFLQSNNIKYKILSPNTFFQLSDIYLDDGTSKAFWKNEFANIASKKLNSYEKSYTMDELNKQFESYKNKIFHKNNKYLMKFLTVLNVFKIFQPIFFYIKDLNIYIKFYFFSDS
jgi:L-ascorbate metabolism protein UlaG (beta-lactamase superfamily)